MLQSKSIRMGVSRKKVAIRTKKSVIKKGQHVEDSSRQINTVLFFHLPQG